jgi:hypothetical protein
MTTKMREVCIKEIEIIIKTTNVAAFKDKIAETCVFTYSIISHEIQSQNKAMYLTNAQIK